MLLEHGDTGRARRGACRGLQGQPQGEEGLWKGRPPSAPGPRGCTTPPEHLEHSPPSPAWPRPPRPWPLATAVQIQVAALGHHGAPQALPAQLHPQSQLQPRGSRAPVPPGCPEDGLSVSQGASPACHPAHPHAGHGAQAGNSTGGGGGCHHPRAPRPAWCLSLASHSQLPPESGLCSLPGSTSATCVCTRENMELSCVFRTTCQGHCPVLDGQEVPTRPVPRTAGGRPQGQRESRPRQAQWPSPAGEAGARRCSGDCECPAKACVPRGRDAASASCFPRAED